MRKGPDVTRGRQIILASRSEPKEGIWTNNPKCSEFSRSDAWG